MRRHPPSCESVAGKAGADASIYQIAFHFERIMTTPNVRLVLPGKPRSVVGTFFRAMRLFTHDKSYVRTLGQLRSFRENRCVDADGNPLPWLNYSLIHFLQERLHRDVKVFEYGSGYSTLFFSQFVTELTSIDHVPEWASLVNDRLTKPGHKVISHSNPHAYVNALPDDQDLVLVDGIHRPEALVHAAQRISPAGVVILDDCHRADYQDAIEATQAWGFKRLTFVGPRPQSLGLGQTSVFYRSENCLQL